MRKLKIVASIAAAFVLVALPATFVNAATRSNPQEEPKNNAGASAVAAALPCQRRSAENSAVKDIFLSTASPKTYTGTSWQDVECATTSFRLKQGQRALVTADFNAEADCNGTAKGQWCQTRALLNGAEGAPVAAEPSSFAFDVVNGNVNDWQAHSMNRGWEIRCGEANGCQYKFAVQTRMHDSTVSGLWLDEIAAHLSVVIGTPVPL